MFYDRNYQALEMSDENLKFLLRSEEQVIVKSALFSGSGRSIGVFKKENGQFRDGEQVLDAGFLRKFGSDFVMQRFVKQHDYYRKFNPLSNNTLRILTYRSVKDDKVHTLHTLLRIGAKGSYLDHDNLGGVSIAIDDNNKLHDHALDINGNKIPKFNEVVFADQPEVAYLDQVKETAEFLAGKFFHGRLLAMDFTVDEKGNPLLLEINCWGNGISQYQMSNGSVFKEFTTEVLDHCNLTKFYNVLMIPHLPNTK
jgi:hypothetical protein